MKKIILHPKILNIDGESDYNMSSKMSTRALKNGYIEEPVSCNFFHFQVSTVGADKNGTPVFVHFSAQDASILIISVAIM